MSDAGQRRNPRELDSLLSRSLQTVKWLSNQLEAGKFDQKLFLQRLQMIEQLIERLMEERKLSAQDERLAKLYVVSHMIGSSLDLQTVLDQVMDAIIQLTRAERGFLMLFEDGKLVIRVARNFDQQTLESDNAVVSRTVTSRVVETQQAVVTTNAQEDPRFAGQSSIVSSAMSSIMASPLKIRDELIGVIYVDSSIKTALFTEDDLQLLDMFGEQAAIAIDNAVQVQVREKALKAEIESLKIEIDESKKLRQVGEIVETEFFKTLRGQAQQLRERKKFQRDQSE